MWLYPSSSEVSRNDCCWQATRRPDVATYTGLTHLSTCRLFPMSVLNSMPSSSSSFSFLYPLLSLRSSGNTLRLLSSSHLSIFPSITCLEDISYARYDQYCQPSFFSFYVGCSFPPWLYEILFFIFHTVGPTDFQHRSPKHFRTSEIGPISDLSDVSKFQSHKMLRSKCIISPLYSWNWSQSCW